MARRDDLLSEVVGDELVVYDRAFNKAHRLNRSAALVWRNCDGKLTQAELSEILRRELELRQPADELVQAALIGLEESGLLQERVTISRRIAAQKVAIAASLIPLIASIALPTPARAASGAISE